MKKFLFTLATLLMAGSMFADNYFYADDFEVSQEMLQNENGRQRRMKVNVKAHFDNLVSAWQVKVTLPEGVEIVNCAALEDMTIQGLDAEGYPKAFPVGLSNNLTAGTFIGASQEAGYYYPEGQGPDTDDPTPCGANKWVPGDYVMFSVTLEFSQDFAGGRLSFSASCSCGDDPRLVDGTYTAPANQDYVNAPDDKICDITVEQPQQPVVAPEPKFDWSAESFTMEAVCEDHNVVLKKDGVEVANPFTVTQTYEEQQITFSAYTVANDDEDENSAVIDTTVVVPAKQKTASNKPSIVVTPGDDNYTIEATGTGTVELYINGEKVEGTTYTVARPAYGEDPITVEVKATNLDSDPDGEIQYEVAEDSKTVTVLAKDPEYYQTPDPKITVSVDNENEKVIITATGEGTVTLKVTGANGTVGETSGQLTCSVEVPFGDVVDYVNAYATATAAGEFVYPGDATEKMIEIPAKTPTLAGQIVFSEVNQDNGQFTVTYVGNEAGVTITLNDETITLVRDVENKYQLPAYGTYPVTATASATGYKSITEDATLVWTKPEPGEKPGVPEVKQVTAETTVTVSAEAENADDVHIYLWDPEANNGEGDFKRDENGDPIEIENPSTYEMGDEAVTFYVKAVAVNENGQTESKVVTIVIPANPATSVNELVNGKTVAGVRYFNMAGQEMQEANGITIVVTTYTDGTTSAVKVIK